MNIGKLNWDTVERLRRTFIEAAPQGGDYWHSQDDLDVYDRTFGQRIAWKWDFVMAELARLNWQAPGGVVLDWACGSGVAGRAFLRATAAQRSTGVSPVDAAKVGTDTFFANDNDAKKVSVPIFAAPVSARDDDARRASPVFELVLQDKSALAVQAAVKFARWDLPGVKVSAVSAPPLPRADVLLVSHVINELSAAQLQEVLALAAAATVVIWVEPGARQAGRALSAVHDQLRDQFARIAPCTHQNPCPMLLAENDRHWCHHFAHPPAEVFGSRDWVKFGQQVGIDLRSLPVSYLVLDKRQAGQAPAPQQLLPTRVIGRPRVYGAYAMILGCNAEGLADRRLMKRHLPDQFKLLRKGRFDTLQSWRCEGIDILEV